MQPGPDQVGGDVDGTLEQCQRRVTQALSTGHKACFDRRITVVRIDRQDVVIHGQCLAQVPARP